MEEMPRELYLYGDICLESVLPIIQQINEINDYDLQNSIIKDYEPEPIIMHINTGGGEAPSGNSLISTIQTSSTHIVGVAEGMVASMGLAVYASCHTRLSSIYTRFMYHSVAYGITAPLCDHISQLEEGKIMQDMYDEVILSVTNWNKEDLVKHQESKTDYWFGAERSVKIGLSHNFVEYNSEDFKKKLEEEVLKELKKEEESKQCDTIVKNNRNKKGILKKLKRVFRD